MRKARTKRIFTSLFVSLLAAATAVGCSPAEQQPAQGDPVPGASSKEEGSTSATEAKEGDLSGEIEIWSWSESEIKTLDENFRAIHPNVKLKYIPVDNGDVNVKLQVAAASDGDFPDIAYQEVMTRGKILSMDIWEDLAAEPYNMDKSMVFDPLLNFMETDDGKILGVDREFNPSGFVYRRSLAKEYLGTDDPAEVSALISDWDKFVETGKKVKEKSGGKVSMLAGLDDINWMLAGQYTDTVFEGDKAHLTPYFTHMFTPMVKIRDAGVASVMKRWTPAWNASYNEGNVLIYEYAPWSGTAALKTNAPDTSGDWTVIEATGGPYTMGGTAYGIPKNAKNKDLAWEFINWTLLTPEGTKACVEDLGVVAPYKAFYNPIPEYQDPFFNNQDVNKFLLENVASKMELRRVHENDGVLNEVMGMMMDTIVADPSITLEKAVQLSIDECKNRLPANTVID